MNYLPNLITSVRLFAALALICLCTVEPAESARYFLPIFVAAGISDMLDGFIARRFNWCSEFGAKLDSVSDLVLYAAVALFLSVNAGSALTQCYWIFVLGCAVQLIHWTLSVSRLGQYPSYHSTFSRIVAYCMFFGMIAFWYTKASVIIAFLAAAWNATSLEGIAITLVLKRPMTNVDSIKAALLLNSRYSIQSER
jgi:CDP-diacylglycerol--glycerol-3-phosphate 3-phosphatidyltransferase